jgi:Cu(I)/Ag(I) efflux system membrane fusion protein
MQQQKKPILTNKEVNVFYTCSMEPQQGNCPICGMSLIKVAKTVAPEADEIRLSDQQMKLGNITTDTIRKGALSDQVVLNATINFDQAKTNSTYNHPLIMSIEKKRTF